MSEDSVNLEDFDYLDFGASKGGSLRFGQRKLGGKRGMGVDLSPQKVETTRAAGFDCIVGDVTRLDLPEKSVKFVTMLHFLEHLPSLALAEAAICNAIRLSTDFVYIRGPFFDEDSYLESLGLKFFFSDWSGHTCKLTVKHVLDLLKREGLNDYAFLGVEKIENSDHAFIHPMGSPSNQRDYNPTLHPRKEFIVFDRVIYRNFVCCIRLNTEINWKKILKSTYACFPIGDWVQCKYGDDA